MPKVEIYTDGACAGNPGPGGWGAVLFSNGERTEISGGLAQTTNNRMELLAAIKALDHLKVRCTVSLFTDSQYVQNGITHWIHGWKKKNWRRGQNAGVKNRDLWQELDRLNQFHDVTWIHVRAHTGNKWNEYVDKLAKSAIPAG